ncbi:hypothetical protein LPJ64_005122 [Coemansia asiatica]|uniref:NAD(P)-binding domain-containing protein n=1 Tax=Coemansia asiatica TaxID=1052880 RepID=A0A9W8CIC9_9FUNG|nr:hypothetical protein LPJ64_005122 [Coemansia asiatica]
MRVSVLGASRNTGRYFVEQAIASGKDFDITILARNPDALGFTPEEMQKITVIKGDALVKDDVARAIEGADIVLCSLGAKINGLSKPQDMGVEETGTLHALDVLKETRQENPPRVIMVSSTGVGETNGNYDVPYILRPIYSILLKAPHKHKTVTEAAIKASGLPYTIVRPALLTNGEATKKYRADIGVSGYTISRRDVAHFVLEQCVLKDNFPNASPSIAY